MDDALWAHAVDAVCVLFYNDEVISLLVKEDEMLIAVRFIGSIKQYTYTAPEGTKVGVYYLDDKLVVVAGTVEKQPNFEVKEFKGIYVHDELERIHIEAIKSALERGDYLVLEEQVKLLNMIRTGLLDKYVNAVPAALIRDYVEWLL